MSNDVEKFLDNKEKELISYPEILDVLEADDIIALDMLINEIKMTQAERRHYIMGADWGQKINALVENDFFDNDDIKVIEKLVSEEKLNNAEKRHYIIGGNLQEKIDILKNCEKKYSLVNNIEKIKSRNVPNIKEVNKGDQLLMSFEFKGEKDHFWCTVTHVETMFTDSKSPLLSISINEKNEVNPEQYVDFGRDNKARSSLIDYSKMVSHNLDIGEPAYNKRVLEVKHMEQPKIKKKPSLR